MAQRQRQRRGRRRCPSNNKGVFHYVCMCRSQLALAGDNHAYTRVTCTHMHLKARTRKHTHTQAHASTRTRNKQIYSYASKKRRKNALKFKSQHSIISSLWILYRLLFPHHVFFLGLFLQPDTFAAVSSGQRDQENSLCQICASKHTCLVTYSETLFLRDKIRVQLMNPYLVVFCWE